MKPEAHLSIHDVTPGTLSRVSEIVELIRDAGLAPPLLLVVAGLDWHREALERLRGMRDAGCELAGHGWTHQAPPPATLHHRVHAVLLSRDRAEHLSRGRGEVLERVRRCHAWFERYGLGSPDTYVPPAWAVGPLTMDDLRELPFRYWETLTGFVDGDAGRTRWLPLVGFEADTAIRRRVLRASNALNLGLARVLRRPVRIGFHPDDLRLLLRADARAILERGWRCVDVREALGVP